MLWRAGQQQDLCEMKDKLAWKHKGARWGLCAAAFGAESAFFRHMIYLLSKVACIVWG